MELEDKIVVITGGTKGLGKALALSFLKNGSKIVVCSRNEDELINLDAYDVTPNINKWVHSSVKQIWRHV